MCNPFDATLASAKVITETGLNQSNQPIFATVNGLRPGEKYNCCVSASNDVGYGPTLSIDIQIPSGGI